MKYSTRPKNTRGRSPKVKRSPHINFQKHHRSQQDVNIYSSYRKLKQSPFQLCSLHRQPQDSLLQRLPKYSNYQGLHQHQHSQQPYIVVDDQQPGTSRQMIFNPPSVAPSQREESRHNTSGLSSLFGAIPSALQYQQIDTPQPFLPSQLSTSTVTSAIFYSS